MYRKDDLKKSTLHEEKRIQMCFPVVWFFSFPLLCHVLLLAEDITNKCSLGKNTSPTKSSNSNLLFYCDNLDVNCSDVPKQRFY